MFVATKGTDPRVKPRRREPAKGTQKFVYKLPSIVGYVFTELRRELQKEQCWRLNINT